MTPDQLWNSTPAEFHAILAARVEDRSKHDKNILECLDTMNAKLCEVVVKAPYIEDPSGRIPSEFQVMKRESNEPQLDMTPEGIQERAFASFREVSG
ncbi:MAG: hypothetical protein M0Q92_02810 [Methanoregula sp.]|jgi:hypothetical protein|nr:hypothetical protein [Methanoregula sp.]